MRDIVSKLGTVRSALTSGTIAVLGSNTTRNGSDINNANYNGVMFYIFPGTYTDGTHTFTIQEADDNGSGAAGSYTNVATTDLVAWKATSTTDTTPVRVGNAQPAAISSAGTNIYQRIGYIGAKQWVRISVTSTGVTTGASYEAVAVLGEPRVLPAAV